MLLEVITDRLFEFGDAGEGAAPDALHRDLGEEALDEVEPRSASRREVEMEARMFREPGLHLGRLVRSVVIEHEMDVEWRSHAAVDPTQEADELLRAMPGLALADYAAGARIEGGEQRGRAVPLVVVRHRGGTTLLQRQAGLGAVERLDLALFVDTENECAIGWVHVEADNVGDLLLEHRIRRDLEALNKMRLQPGLFPDALHARPADASGLRHCPHAPVRRARRRLARGLGKHLLTHALGQRRRARRPRLVAHKPVDTLVHEALLPPPDAGLRLAGRAHDRHSPEAVGRGEDDLGAPHELGRCVAIARDGEKPFAVSLAHGKGYVLSHQESMTDLTNQRNYPSGTEH